MYDECREHLPRHIYWIIYTVFRTGMRRGELLGLKWESVDLVNRTIRVEAAVAKSGKARTIRINEQDFPQNPRRF